MTQGGPENATATVVWYMVHESIHNVRVGYASAVPVVFFLIVLMRVIPVMRSVVVTEEREMSSMALTTKKKVRASVTPLQKASLRSLSSGRKYAWLTLNYLLMVLLAIFFLFPTVFMMVSSLKANENQLLQELSTVSAFIPYADISLQDDGDPFHRLPSGLCMV